MKKEAPNLDEVLSDLAAIKEAFLKSSGIFRFFDAGGLLRGVLLIGGILIAFFAAAFHLLVKHYGTFAAAPAHYKALFWILLALSIPLTAYLKINNFLRGARLVKSNMTLYKLIKEIYTPQFISMSLPHLAAIALAVFFLYQKEMTLYLVPVLALLFGLFTVSLSLVFYMKWVYLLGFWLVAAGLLTLFAAERLSIPAMLVLSFSAGFILAALYLYARPSGSGS
ncbi:MAG TPA: hypothetical protein PLZ49_02415 [Bacillota bacterium]|jgi:hypothetical protein|nr:hypothetical protein [Bacillota bacterium]HOL15028.1 hypothetical protein [Bacillota bacterium]